MKIVDRIAAGAAGGLVGTGTFQATGRKIAEDAVHIGGKDAALITAQGASIVGGVGITAAVSAVMSQMDYEAKKKDLKKFYKEEIASALGKPLKKVRDGDVDKLAKGNHVVAEQMKKTRRARLVNIGTIFTATAIAVGLVAAAAGAGIFAPIAAIGAGAEIAGGLTVGGLLSFSAKAGLAMLAYQVVRRPLQKLADSMTGLSRETTHEMIEAIHRDHAEGKTVSKEQVFAVFVAANPELDKFIKTRYGKDFDNLSVSDKEALTDAIGSKLDIPAMTDDINAGRVKATELAFAVEGKISGVLPRPGDSPKHSALMTIKEKLHQAGDYVQHMAHKDSVPGNGFVQRLEASRAAQQSATQQR